MLKISQNQITKLNTLSWSNRSGYERYFKLKSFLNRFEKGFPILLLFIFIAIKSSAGPLTNDCDGGNFTDNHLQNSTKLRTIELSNNFDLKCKQLCRNNLFVDQALHDGKTLASSFRESNKLVSSSTFHLFSHGQPGELLIEGEWKNSIQIKNWITENQIPLNNKQLNIYGCNFAKGEKGKAAVSYLEMTLGVSIAASDDITGKDGDWDLEVGIAEEIVCIDNYQSNLQSATATYSAGDIPTGDQGWPGGCTASTLQVTIPAGSEVTGVDVVYDMTAANNAYMSEQRSQIYYVEGSVDEGGFASGTGGTVGTFSYNRPGLSLANGISASGILNFEMHTYRTWTGGAGCNTTYNKVDNNTWSITVHYQITVDPCDAAASGNLDTDGDNVSDICDLDNDNDGILDADECIGTVSGTPTPDGVEDGNFPIGYWDAEYYNGHFGIPNSTYGNSATDSDSTGANNSPLYLGEAYFGVNSLTFTDSRTFTETQTPTSVAVAPSGYVGVNSDGNGNPYYQIHFNRKMDTDGTLTFGGSGYFDDVMEVFVNGTQEVFAGGCCGATPNPNSTVINVPYLAGDDVQIRYTNFGWIGGYEFSFVMNNVGCSDSDGDGTPDYLDTDSDNDGCPDALEGDGGFTYAAIQNDTLTGGVDTDGIPVVATSSGQANLSATDANVQADECDPCNSTSTLFTDNDTDGVGDVCDLDNDNDGILDSDECSTDNLTISSVSTTTPLFQGDVNSLIDGLNGAGVPFIDIDDTAPYPWDFEFTLTNTSDVSSLGFWNGGGNFPGDAAGRFDLIFKDNGGVEISRITGLNLMDLFTVQNFYFPEVAEVTSVVVSITAQIGVQAELNELTFGTCDTDDDGISNFLDSDSDGDNCPDAIEGTGNFTFIDIQNDTLTGGVDTLGIPTVATASGQGIGSSQDSTQMSLECMTIAENDINQTPQDTPVDGNVLTNDSDPSGDAQTVTAITYVDITGATVTVAVPTGGTDVTVTLGDGAGGTAGTLAINEDGEYTFTPETGYTGDVPTIDYEVTDATGATASASLDLDVIPGDDPATDQAPVANDDTNTTDQDVNVSGNLIDGNDSDPDTPQDDLVVTAATGLDANGDPVTITPGGSAVNIYDENGTLAGSMTVGTDGSYTFDPAPTFTGDVPVTYTIEDPEGGSSTAGLTITVNPDPSGTTNNTYTNDDANSGPAGEDQAGNLLTNDNDPEGNDQDITLIDTDGDGIPDALPVAGAPNSITQGGVTVGTLTINPATGEYVWTPEPDFVGTVSIPYTACDDQMPAACEVASLYVTTLPINSTESKDDFTNTPFDTPVTGDASTNDQDEEGDTQSFTSNGANGGMDSVTDGSVTMNPDGTYTFTPVPGFVGETSFEYVACDNGTPASCDTSTVYIEVFPDVNPEEVLIVANPDANTLEEGQTGTGNVMSNDLDPDAIDPAVVTTLNGVTVSGIDEDGNPVADAGTLTLDPNGDYIFIPTGSFTGTVTQEYVICDGALPALACDTTDLMISVIPDNTNTTFANDDAVVTDAGVAAEGDVLVNDSDSEMDDQLITSFLVDTDGDGVAETAGAVDMPTTVGGTNDMGVFVMNAGSLTLNEDGTYDFVPAPGFVGNVNVPYTACDTITPTPACDDATLVITILDVQRDYGDAPVIYPVAWHRAMTDTDDPVDNVLDGATDVWLGAKTGFESAQQASTDAMGDSFDDAISFGSSPGQFPLAAEPGVTYPVDVVVNGNQSGDEVHFGMWIDWNADGVYDNFYFDSGITNSPDTVVVNVTTPGNFAGEVNIRLRADDDQLSMGDFTGGKTNGEIEDYQAMLVLPVELISFTGLSKDCNVQLDWSSATQENFSHYEVESSTSGTRFTTISIVQGLANSNFEQQFQYYDQRPSRHNYYRLKMVDKDGSFEYSEVINVNVDCYETVINVYPNPVVHEGLINIDIETRSEKVELVIVNMLGNALKSVKVNVQPDALNTIPLEISDLPSGSYMITMKEAFSNSITTSKIFIIQE